MGKNSYNFEQQFDGQRAPKPIIKFKLEKWQTISLIKGNFQTKVRTPTTQEINKAKKGKKREAIYSN